MDPQKLKDAFERLQLLDDRTHKVRPRTGGSGPLQAPRGVEQLDERLRELAAYTVDLKEIVEELFRAIAAKPESKPPTGGQQA